MNLENIGNPEYVYVDKNRHAIREGLWYTHPSKGAIKVMGLSDIKLDYQNVDMQNTSVYKVLSGHVSLDVFFKSCECTGFLPNGKVINPDLYDLVAQDNELSSIASYELIKELISRNSLRLVDEELNLYQFKNF